MIDFLHKCFDKEMKDRPTAQQLLQHTWILNVNRAHQNTIRRLNTMQELQDSVMKYNEVRSLKRQNSRASIDMYSFGGGNDDEEVVSGSKSGGLNIQPISKYLLYC